MPAALAQGPMQSGTHVQPDTQKFDVANLFANTCGWCHFDAGRKPGKGPQLMGTTLTDEEITYRIRHGKIGAMPAFGSQFNDDQLRAIVAYIRALKPGEESK
jgi:mono/diheme cytochrome c family protein